MEDRNSNRQNLNQEELNMKKQLLLLVLVMLPLVASADAVEINGIYYNLNTDDKVAEVTRNPDEYADNIVIPGSFNYDNVAYSVTSIGKEAFFECSGLTSVTIGNGVTSIGDNAFFCCSGLTSVTIPSSVTSIGINAFSGCYLEKVIVKDLAAWCGIKFGSHFDNPLRCAKHLYSDENTVITNLVIPDGVTSIGDNAFYECTGLTSVTIPNSVTSIGQFAFAGCSGLTSVTIGNSVTSIGQNAFAGCSGLTSVTIGNSVTSIGQNAFAGCSGLTSVTIGNSVTSIGNRAFDECTGLTSIIVESGNTKYDSRDNCNAIIETASNTLIHGFQNTIIPNSVTSIGEDAFRGCTGLTSINIPNSVTSIGGSAFEDCRGLTSVTIPNSVTSIGSSAFEDCSGLTSVTIPNSVTSIGSYAFEGCSGLTSITIPNSVTSIGSRAFEGCSGLKKVIVSDIAAWCGIEFYSDYCNPLIYVKHLYSDENTEITDLVIPNSVTSIGNYAFDGCSSLTSVIIPNSVKSIGDYAFEGCSGLTSITIPNSVTSIGNYAFRGCSGLTSVTIPNSVRGIGRGAFKGCSNLSSVTVERSKPYGISDDTFSNRANATLYVPKSGKSIYESAAYWNEFKEIVGTDVPVITFADANVKAICVTNWDIDRDRELDYAEAASVTNLGEVFKGNTQITSFDELQYFTGLTSIGYYAFQGCSSLTSITIPNSVTSIGYYAFQGCSRLTSMTIPNSVTSIGYYAFRYCSRLTSVTIGNSVTSIGQEAFYECSGLTSVTIGNSVTSIGWLAFAYCSGLKKVIVSDIAAWCGIKFRDHGNPLYYAHHLYSDENTEITDLVIPNSVTNIGENAFNGCSGLTSVTIPNSVTSIGYQAFKGCSSLTSVEIPNSVTSIGSLAFDGTAWYNNQPDGLVYAGKVAYNYKGSMPANTSITLKEGTLAIAGSAFSGCSGLTSVTIGNGLTGIGYGAFSNCSGLTSIIIPNSVTKIQEYAFSGCSGLVEVYCKATTPPMCTGDGPYFNYEEAKLYVPAGTVAQYQAADYWKNFSNIAEFDEPFTLTANNLEMVYGDALPEFTYTTSGGAFSGTPQFTCEATPASPVGAYPIVISQGTIDNDLGTYVNGTLTIKKAPLKITAKDYNIKQGETLPTLEATYEGFKNDETSAVLTKQPTITTTATSASEPGEYEITIGGAEATNYEINYIKGKLTITEADPVTITAKSYTIKYGDDLPTFEFTSEGTTIEGTPAIACEATKTSPVGTYSIVITKGTVKNYNDTYVNGTLTIEKAPLTITAKSYTIKQGEPLPTFEAEYSGFKNNETANVLTKQPTITTTATSASEPGEYEITVSGAEAKNYAISFFKGKLTITEADPVTITAKSYTIKYGDELPTFEFTSEGSTLEGTPAITCEATKTSAVDTYPIVITKGSVTNYNTTFVNGTLTIEKAPLTITAKSYTIKQGETLPTFEAEYSGFKNNETKAVLSTQPTITTTAISTSEPGEYEITVSGAEAQNYEISYVAGKLTITESDGIRMISSEHPVSVFDIQGHKVRSNVTSLEGLPKGVYIINGRKVVIK